MVEIGTSGWPWRASGIAIGAALGAEADGAHTVWFADELPAAIDPVAWAEGAGALLPLVPDPADIADPVVTAGAALLVTRRTRVGVLGWAPGLDATRAARTLASLADLAPDRAIVALRGEPAELRAVADALPADAPLELAVYGGAPDTARALGWRWIAVAEPPELVAKQARDAGVNGPVGVHLPVVVHDDPEVARSATAAPLLAAFVELIPPDGLVVGDPARLGAVIDEYVEQGVDRIVLDDLLPFGAPAELQAGRAAVRIAIRGALLRHRAGPGSDA
jgi:hypothetical protein